MQSAEDFMQAFFCARTAEIKNELERRSIFRRKFFSDACCWDSRKGAVERSEAENIESVSRSDLEVQVITREIEPFPRLCYHLKMTSGGWIIENVAFECMYCHGNEGNTSCIICLGNGWVQQEDFHESMHRLEKRKP